MFFRVYIKVSKAALTRSLIQWSLLHWWVIDESSLRKWRPFTRSFSGWSLICDAMIADKMMTCYTIINAMKHVFLLMRMTASKAQVFATRRRCLRQGAKFRLTIDRRKYPADHCVLLLISDQKQNAMKAQWSGVSPGKRDTVISQWWPFTRSFS